MPQNGKVAPAILSHFALIKVLHISVALAEWPKPSGLHFFSAEKQTLQAAQSGTERSMAVFLAENSEKGEISKDYLFVLAKQIVF